MTCCKEDAEKNKNAEIVSSDEHKSKKESHCTDTSIKKSPLHILLYLFGAVLLLNVIVMGVFTLRVSTKLDEAINITKPQEGALTVVVPDDCPLCGEMTAEQSLVLKQNINLTDTTVVSAGSPEGKALIETYQFTQLPALIFSASEPIKSSINKAFESSARLFDDVTAVWEDTVPPYVDIEDSSVRGLVDVIYLTDKSCAECYDVRQAQRAILTRLGIAIDGESVLDVGEQEGKALLDTYNIISVPTIILSQEANVYSQLSQVWQEVGTQESDGAFVFRKNEALGNVVYKNLATGEIVQPENK